MVCPLDLTLAWISLGTIALLCLPAVSTALFGQQNNGPIDRFYEDIDGSGTPESIAAFSNRRCKFLILVFATLGFTITVSIFLLEIMGGNRCDGTLEAGFIGSSWVSVNTAL